MRLERELPVVLAGGGDDGVFEVHEQRRAGGPKNHHVLTWVIVKSLLDRRTAYSLRRAQGRLSLWSFGGSDDGTARRSIKVWVLRGISWQGLADSGPALASIEEMETRWPHVYSTSAAALHTNRSVSG